MALCSIGELAVTLGVSVPTLRRWHREGKQEPACRTVGGHRRYDRDRVVQAFGLHKAEGLTVTYARVSSHDQKGQLQTQAERLRRYCHERGWASLSIEDLVEILTVFSSRLYGARSRKNLKRLAV
jgi:putative resolvase